MTELERAYELADKYADVTDGYVGIRVCRYRFPFTNQIDIDYVLTAQSLVNPISFASLSALIRRLEELLNE
jgi:hypothetical protein